MKFRLVFAALLLAGALAQPAEASACSTAWSTCIGSCRYGNVLCHSGATGSPLCDTSESICEERCTSDFLDCANGGRPAV